MKASSSIASAAIAGPNLIPGHASQDHGHATSVRNSREHQACADEHRQPNPVRVEKIAQS